MQYIEIFPTGLCFGNGRAKVVSNMNLFFFKAQSFLCPGCLAGWRWRRGLWGRGQRHEHAGLAGDRAEKDKRGQWKPPSVSSLLLATLVSAQTIPGNVRGPPLSRSNFRINGAISSQPGSTSRSARGAGINQAINFAGVLKASQSIERQIVYL